MRKHKLTQKTTIIFRFLHLERCPKGVGMKAKNSIFTCKKVKNIMTKGKKGTALVRSVWAVSMTAQQKKNGSYSLD